MNLMQEGINWACLGIIANCCVNYSYIKLYDHFGCNNGALDVYLT